MKLSEIKKLLRLMETNPKFRQWVEKRAFKIGMKQSMAHIIKERFK